MFLPMNSEGEVAGGGKEGKLKTRGQIKVCWLLGAKQRKGEIGYRGFQGRERGSSILIGDHQEKVGS